jgi:hypothetical protein
VYSTRGGMLTHGTTELRMRGLRDGLTKGQVRILRGQFVSHMTSRLAPPQHAQSLQ